jgi:glycosyltransferase involved in cell wall biosynthesis
MNRERPKDGRPRILFVAMGNSPHAARWISQLEGVDWDVYLFPNEPRKLAPLTPLFAERAPSTKIVDSWPKSFLAPTLAAQLHLRRPGWDVQGKLLTRVIRGLRPDIIHSLEIQHAGYLVHRTLVAFRMLREQFPTWIVSNWGSDTYIFGRIEEHRERLQEVFGACDYYMSECQRDIEPARRLGFRGTVLPVFPAAGGVDLASFQRFRQPGPVSERRVIALRGYHGWAGRSLVGLRGIERAADALRDYKIVIYLASPEVPLAVELLVEKTKLDIEILPYGPHENIWRLFGSARALVALSIGDGISTSMLEAITMGAFPIQSNTSCADEWLRDGETGILVEAEEPEQVERALRRVVADDELVDRAAATNFETVMQRLDTQFVRPRVIEMYEQIVAQALTRRQQSA